MEMLNCVSLLLHHQMAEDPPNPDIGAPAYDFSEDESAANPNDMPELDEISNFLKKTFKVAKWSPECHIMALVFVNRLTGFTNIRLHNSNWRPILLCSLLLAQKVRACVLSACLPVCLCCLCVSLSVSVFLSVCLVLYSVPYPLPSCVPSCGTINRWPTSTSRTSGRRQCQARAIAKLGDGTHR